MFAMKQEKAMMLLVSMCITYLTILPSESPLGLLTTCSNFHITYATLLQGTIIYADPSESYGYCFFSVLKAENSPFDILTSPCCPL